jgi:hypothetical protein
VLDGCWLLSGLELGARPSRRARRSPTACGMLRCILAMYAANGARARVERGLVARLTSG